MANNPTILSEIFDPQRVSLVCEVHNYTAGSGLRQHRGCAGCNKVDYIYMLAKTPPDQRREMLDRFEALVTAMCELEDEGKLDVNIQRHPSILVEKDAA